MSYCPLFKIRFPDFSWIYFNTSEWKLVANFRMKSYRSSLTFITVELLFILLLLFVKNGSWLFFLLYEDLQIKFKNIKQKIQAHTWATSQKEQLFFMNMCDKIMVADLNLFVPVGDLYCFYSDSASVLLYFTLAILSLSMLVSSMAEDLFTNDLNRED